MNLFRIALGNLRIPSTPEESVTLAEHAIAQAGERGAGILCFPECYIPGYRIGRSVPPPDAAFLERAWSRVAEAARKAKITVILGTERVVEDGLRITALVIQPDGGAAGFQDFQDKVQLDPSEDATYVPGDGRRVFETGPLRFGIAICHEGFRYPETVRWAAQRGAQVVFHPHFNEAEPGGYAATAYADPANSFHEKAALCRAAENTCYYATVNAASFLGTRWHNGAWGGRPGPAPSRLGEPPRPCASFGPSTTSAIVNPDGTLLCYQPYGEEGLLIGDVDLDAATGLLARRVRSCDVATIE